MRPSTRNLLPPAAGRASDAFCLAAEPEHSRLPLNHQALILGSKGAIALLKPKGVLLGTFEMPSRGDAMTVAVHLHQVPLVTFHVHELVKQFEGSSQEAWAA
jgi:hypothetical protein